jgi:hypothetical protein
MKLFYAPGACSLLPDIVAREAGIGLAPKEPQAARTTPGSAPRGTFRLSTLAEHVTLDLSRSRIYSPSRSASPHARRCTWH